MNTINTRLTLVPKAPIIGFVGVSASSNTEVKISYVLRQLGIGFHVSGYSYIKRAVIMVMDDPSYAALITKRLYPDIAKEFGTTWASVERCMRNAIKSINCDDYTKITYLGSLKKGYTNKEFIMNIVELIKFST